MTGLVERAVAREISTAELAADVVDGDSQPAREQVVAIAPHCLSPTELERMRVPPLRRAAHDQRARRQPCALSTRSLQALRHQGQFASGRRSVFSHTFGVGSRMRRMTSVHLLARTQGAATGAG